MDTQNTDQRSLPLSGIRVLEMGQLIAGPFAGQMLAAFGAEVIKIEPPGKGDPLRTWRELDEDGCSYWWRSIARNKKSVTLNLSKPAGCDIARRLLPTREYPVTAKPDRIRHALVLPLLARQWRGCAMSTGTPMKHRFV